MLKRLFGISPARAQPSCKTRMKQDAEAFSAVRKVIDDKAEKKKRNGNGTPVANGAH